MASTYSPNLRLELIGTGDQQGTWGATTNTNLGTLLEEAIGGYVSVTVSDVADTTLTTNNGSADQSRNMVINLTGTISAARNVICPAIEKVYIVKNATTGGYAVTFKVSGQTGVSIPNGSTYILYVNGTDATLAGGTMSAQNANAVSITGGSITGITDLAVADGGTGASSFTSYSVLLGGTTSTGPIQNVSGLGTSGQALVSNGAGAAPSWQTLQTFASGTALVFAQTAAPTGWTKSTTHNNKALRVVSGTASSGGNVSFTAAFTSQSVSGNISSTTATGNVGSTTLSTNQIPAHTHTYTYRGDTKGGGNITGELWATTVTSTTGSTGGGGSHNHSFTGDAHTHTFTGSAIDLAVQYVDVIIATKD